MQIESNNRNSVYRKSILIPSGLKSQIELMRITDLFIYFIP